MNPRPGIRHLYHLARFYGIQTAYYDVYHHRQQASTASLLAVLQLLGAPIETLQDVPAAWRERRQSLWQRILQPVTIAWDDRLPIIQLRLPSDTTQAIMYCHMELETAEEQSWELRMDDLPVVEAVEIEQIHYVVRQICLPTGLPWGYHRFSMELAGQCAETLIISAPLKAYVPPEEDSNRMWGVFLPLYTLRTDKSWGGGDFSDLEALTTWVAEMGGQVVATLPLLATFLNNIFEPSPYLPASRLLWNEFYLDINKVPELRECSSAQALLESSSFQSEITSQRRLSLVDYRRQMTLKRRVLEELCRCLFAGPSRRLEDLQHFTSMNPAADDYARFRATGEKLGTSWRFWPPPLRDGTLSEDDYSDDNRRYHLYVQWLAHQQIETVSKKFRDERLQLYLDLPLGVHPDGYDVWRKREAFIPNTSVGAPPDAVFNKGQSWEFPPLHPERIQEEGYRYFIACLRHHLQYASILRIDHVMGFHRLFCIPNGMEPAHGVYVRYQAEEFYAILALESHRNKAIIVGEDLGTVPPCVRPAMKRHNLHQMYVLYYELATDLGKRLRSILLNSVVSLNTHDMPPFAGFWQGLDIDLRRGIGLLDKADVKEEKNKLTSIKKALVTFLQDRGWLHGSEDDILPILKACLSFLAASTARVVLVNLEDLWLETQSQNVPSTKVEYPNWQRHAQYSLDQFCQLPQVTDTLQAINELRKRGKHKL